MRATLSTLPSSSFALLITLSLMLDFHFVLKHKIISKEKNVISKIFGLNCFGWNIVEHQTIFACCAVGKPHFGSSASLRSLDGRYSPLTGLIDKQQLSLGSRRSVLQSWGPFYQVTFQLATESQSERPGELTCQIITDFPSKLWLYCTNHATKLNGKQHSLWAL